MKFSTLEDAVNNIRPGDIIYCTYGTNTYDIHTRSLNSEWYVSGKLLTVIKTRKSTHGCIIVQALFGTIICDVFLAHNSVTRINA